MAVEAARLVVDDGVDIAQVQEQRRRLARAYADGGFTDPEYRARMGELDAQLGGPVRLSEYREVIELVSDMDQIMEADAKGPGHHRCADRKDVGRHR